MPVIVDAHVHIFERIRGLTEAGVTESLSFGKVRWGGKVIRSLPPLAVDTRFPPEVLLEYMDWAGVDKAVILQGPFYGEANLYVRRAVKRWPDRFLGVAYFDPWSKKAPDGLSYLAEELGFNAIKLELREDTGFAGLHPDLRIDDARIEWMWQEVEQRGLVTVLDLGPIGSRGYQTEAVKKVLGNHPALTVVMAHLCYPPVNAQKDEQLNRLWQDQVLLARHPRVWLDLASLPVLDKDEDFPYPSACEFIRQAAELVGSDKLLWGTDIPSLLTAATYPQLLRFVEQYCDFLSDVDRNRILGDNALRVYGRCGL